MSVTGQELITMYREIAARGEQFRGYSILQHADEIGELLGLSRAVSVLDYGSGAGAAYEPPHMLHERWGVAMPTLYDPAFEGIDVPPPAGTKFDFVICSDVLEHVPMDLCEAFITTLFEYTDNILWASVCTRAAKKCFADGTNMHVTVRPLKWWTRVFERVAAGRGVGYRLTETL